MTKSQNEELITNSLNISFLRDTLSPSAQNNINHYDCISVFGE